MYNLLESLGTRTAYLKLINRCRICVNCSRVYMHNVSIVINAFVDSCCIVLYLPLYSFDCQDIHSTTGASPMELIWLMYILHSFYMKSIFNNIPLDAYMDAVRVVPIHLKSCILWPISNRLFLWHLFSG